MQQSQTPSEVGISLSHPRAAGTACTTTSTPTTPTNAKSSEPCEMCVSADALSVATGAMDEEEEEVEDDGKTVALAKGGVTDLARTAGRTSLVREVGGTHLARGVGEISLARIAHKAMRASLLLSWENEHLWGRAPFRSGRERRAHEEQIEAKHVRDFT